MELVLLSLEGQTGGIQTLKNESKEELFCEMLTPSQSWPQVKREWERRSEKDRPWSTKMMCHRWCAGHREKACQTKSKCNEIAEPSIQASRMRKTTSCSIPACR